MPTSGFELNSVVEGRVSGLTKHSPAEHIHSRFTSAGSVEGTLKGWDQLLNLVLDDIEELLVGAYGYNEAPQCRRHHTALQS